MSEFTQEIFEKNVALHKCTCLLNNGLYRHYHFANPQNSNMYFDITTWPGYLCFSGDMGCYVFARIDDMFAFFRGDVINTGYWGEKLEAVDRSDGYTVWSKDDFEESVKECWKNYFEGELGSEEAIECWKRIQDDILYYSNSEYEAVNAINNFDPVKKYGSGLPGFDFSDFWDGGGYQEYTYRYLWCCSAIVWAIKQIDSLDSLKEIKTLIQINGKPIDTIIVSTNITEEEIKQKALANEKVITIIAGKNIQKIVVIKTILVNIIVDELA